MWYLAALAVLTAIIWTWFFFKNAASDLAVKAEEDAKIKQAEARAAVSAVVEQVKEIAAKNEPPPPVEKPKKKRAPRAVAVKSPKPAAPKKATKRIKKQWPT